jgi:hypothetical protein
MGFTVNGLDEFSLSLKELRSCRIQSKITC